MAGPIHEWLPEHDQGRWICAHMKCLLEHLEKVHDVRVLRAGLENPKLPSAVLFPSVELQLPQVEPILHQQQCLVAHINGLGALIAVQCQEHPVSLQSRPFAL
jgi:hypothetical protein